MVCLYVAVDRSFVSLMVGTWPLLSLNKTQLNASYLTQHIVDTAGLHHLLLLLQNIASIKFTTTDAESSFFVGLRL